MESRKIRQSLFLLGFISVMVDSSNISTVSVSNVSLHTNVSLDVSDCSFGTVDRYGKEQILKFIDEKKELIFIHFSLQNYSNIFPLDSDGNIYKMLDLVRTAGSYGDELLLLHPQFEQLSLGTLMFSVEHVEIKLKPMSSQCFFNSTEDKIHNDLLTFASKEFRLLDNSSSVSRICSMFVENIQGRADFEYKCCFRNDNSSFECRTIEKAFWVNTLFVVMTIVYIIAFLYSPLLIPTSWYKDNVKTCFFFPENMGTLINGESVTHLEKINNIILKKKIKSHVDNLSGSFAKYWKINMVKLKLQDMNDTSSCSALGSMFHIKKEHEHIKECCYAKCCVFPCIKSRWKWQTCLRSTMPVVLMVCLWFLRLFFFYFYEEVDRNDREHFADQLNLKYPNMFKWNLTYSLKPDHSFFILCYVLILFTIVSRSYIRDVLYKAEIHKTADNINSLLGKWFENVLIPFRKCGILGFVICPIYLALVVPYVVFRYILPSIPLVRTSFILLHIFRLEIKNRIPIIFGITEIEIEVKAKGIKSKDKYKGAKIKEKHERTKNKEKHERTKIKEKHEGAESEDRNEGTDFTDNNIKTKTKKIITHHNYLEFLMVIIGYMLFLLSFATSLILCLEIIMFVLQIIMYFAIGFVLNASHVITYITFAGMLIFYAYNSIRHVLGKYEFFRKTVMKYIISNLGDSIINKGSKNVALQLQVARACDPPHQSVLVRKNNMVLSSKIPFVFLDDHGKLSLNDDVFLEMCNLNLTGAPGSLWINIKKAFIHFFIIFLFLLFVATIVLAFGQSKGVTGTYLALATLGGGLIPLILRKFLFQSHYLSDDRTEQVFFWDEVKSKLNEYETIFEIADITGQLENDPLNKEIYKKIGYYKEHKTKTEGIEV